MTEYERDLSSELSRRRIARDAALATDPPVSEPQRRAMEAAAHGHSTLGIPKSVGEEFVGKDELSIEGAAAALKLAKQSGDKEAIAAAAVALMKAEVEMKRRFVNGRSAG